MSYCTRALGAKGISCGGPQGVRGQKLYPTAANSCLKVTTCDSDETSASSSVTHGSPGKRGPRGVRGHKGAKGDIGRSEVDDALLFRLEAMNERFTVLESALEATKTIVEKIRNDVFPPTYTVVKTERAGTYAEVVAMCEQMGGSILSRLLRKVDLSGKSYKSEIRGMATERLWIGLSDAEEEGSWVTTRGTFLRHTITSFDDYEPNGGLGENCAVIYPNLRIRDYPCNFKFFGLCEVVAN